MATNLLFCHFLANGGHFSAAVLDFFLKMWHCHSNHCIANDKLKYNLHIYKKFLASYNNRYSKTCPYRNALGTNFYSGLDRFRFGEGFCFREEQTTITCTIGMRVIIQDVSSVGLQMIGGRMQIN